MRIMQMKWVLQSFKKFTGLIPMKLLDSSWMVYVVM